MPLFTETVLSKLSLSSSKTLHPDRQAAPGTLTLEIPMDPVSEAYDYTSWPNSVAANIIFFTSLIGAVFNLAILYAFFSAKKNNAFHLICLFRALNNLYVLFVVMLGVFFPESILGYSIYPPLMESILITTGINLMVFNEFQSIYTAVNRLFAIFFPIKYNLFFGIKPTLAFHILYYLDRIRNLTMEHFDRYKESNFMTFSPKYLAYGGDIVSPDGMFYWGLALLIFPFLINIVTFIRFHYMKKRTSRESEHWKKAKKNMILFLQTVFQDSLFSLNVFFALKWNTLIDHRFWTFICQTLAWQTIHVLDGFIMLLFNDGISFCKKAKVSPIVKVENKMTSNVAMTRTIVL
ncbi:unnamed protein product [Caenorhabditis nigoni]